MNNSLLRLCAIPVLHLWLLISPAVHAADHQCTDCHISATHNTDDLKKPLSTLCVDCHAARIKAGEHMVNIAASSLSHVTAKAPEITLPLLDGKLSCVTCHDPHKPSLALRLPTNDLCQHCHKK